MGLFGKSTGFKENQSVSERTVGAAKLLWRIVSFPFRALWKAAAFGVKLTATWWKDRKLVHLLRGIPTLLLAAVCVYFVLGMKPGFSRADKYRTAGLAACETENWETAKLFLDRAAALGAADTDMLFSLARAAEKTNDAAQMVTILERLAPSDHAVHLPAHFWKATQLLAPGRVSKEQGEQARTHLKHVLALNAEHSGASAILGDMYYQEGLWSAAAIHLENAPRGAAKYRLMLAHSYLRMGDRIKAERCAREAQDWAKKLSDNDPLNVDRRLLWAQATTFLEEYEEAIRILATTLEREEDPRLRAGLTTVYIHWADSIEGVSDVDSHNKFERLAEGMKHNPNDVMLFDRLMKILDQKGKASEEVKTFLNKNITQKQAVGISHLMLGTSAWIEGEEEQAAIHLEMAFAQLPDAATVANNFAWYLTNKEPSEPKRALKLISPVLEKVPENHYIRDTRGHIYLKLGQWKDAVSDLEYAVQGLSTNRMTHEGLATAYRNLGLTELADEYDRTAKTLKNTTSP